MNSGLAGDTLGLLDVAVPDSRSRREAAAEGERAAKHVGLLIDPSNLRAVHAELASRLVHEGRMRVTLLRGQARRPTPSSVQLLISLERLIHRLTGGRLIDKIDLPELDLPEPSPGEAPDLIIDCCGDERALGKGRAFRLLFDGVPGETAAIGAIVAGRMPIIEVKDVQTGTILASGAPSADNAGTVSGAFECVLARVVTLVLAAVRGVAPSGPVRPSAARSARMKDVVAFEAKVLASAIIHHLYELCFYTPHWRTCWRFLDGPDLWQTRNLTGTTWNIIPDPGFRFYADPFPFVHDGRTYLFLEDLDHRTNKAVISVVPFRDQGPSGPAEPVLEEPWHLSYPFVFAHDGQIWMIPESSANRAVTLYRADPFPSRWVAEETLIGDIEASDATLVHHNGDFWIFAATRDGGGSWSDTLSLFYAPSLCGPWKAHPANPVLVDQAGARPAGATVVRGGQLWRPVQDCTAGYGTGIGLAEVTRLDRQAFSQKIHAVVQAKEGWPGRRLHTLNRAGRLECIDGSAYSPRNRLLARRLETWSGRREPD